MDSERQIIINCVHSNYPDSLPYLEAFKLLFEFLPIFKTKFLRLFVIIK